MVALLVVPLFCLTDLKTQAGHSRKS